LLIVLVSHFCLNGRTTSETLVLTFTSILYSQRAHFLEPPLTTKTCNLQEENVGLRFATGRDSSRKGSYIWCLLFRRFDHSQF